MRSPSLFSVTGDARIVIADDHLTFAEAIGSRLEAEPGMSVVGIVASGGQLMAVIDRGEVDVVLLDERLGDEDCVDLVRRIRDARPEVAVVLVAENEDPERVVAAIRAGISAWVPKASGLGQLLAAVRGAAAGEAWIPGAMLTAVLRQLTATAGEGRESAVLLDQLTVREREILQCMVDGCSRAEVARRLYLSPNTVRTHVQNVLHKFGVHSSLTAVAIARRAGMESRGWAGGQAGAAPSPAATAGSPPAVDEDEADLTEGDGVLRIDDGQGRALVAWSGARR